MACSVAVVSRRATADDVDGCVCVCCRCVFTCVVLVVVDTLRNCFELFGYDFLVDEDMRVWLLEVNTNPYLGAQNDWHASLLPAMVRVLLLCCGSACNANVVAALRCATLRVVWDMSCMLHHGTRMVPDSSLRWRCVSCCGVPRVLVCNTGRSVWVLPVSLSGWVGSSSLHSPLPSTPLPPPSD